jgi:hypothetical protein
MFSKLIKNLFKETTNVTDITPVTFNSSGSYNPKYGKKKIIITGKGGDGFFVASNINPYIPAGATPGNWDGGNNSYYNNPTPVSGAPASFYPGVPSSFYPGVPSSFYPGDLGGNFANWNYTTQVVANGTNAVYTPGGTTLVGYYSNTNPSGNSNPSVPWYTTNDPTYTPGNLNFAPTEVITGSNVNPPISSSFYPGVASSFNPGVPSSYFAGNSPYSIAGTLVPGNANYYPPTPYPATPSTSNPAYSNTGPSSNIDNVSLPGGYGSAATVSNTSLNLRPYDKNTKSVTVPSGGYVTVTIKII